VQQEQWGCSETLVCGPKSSTGKAKDEVMAHKDKHTADQQANRADEMAERHDGQLAVEPNAEIEELRRQASEAQDRYLRSQADLENTRKRLRREMEEERRYAELGLLADLLPVIDNMNRAINAAEKNADAASLLEGFKMVRQQLDGVLEKHHCRPIAADGQPFDPAYHEAILQQPSDKHPENTVIAVGQTGYRLHDRMVRPAQVVVSSRPADS
jgi:molecular chaperone GrpE